MRSKNGLVKALAIAGGLLGGIVSTNADIIEVPQANLSSYNVSVDSISSTTTDQTGSVGTVQKTVDNSLDDGVYLNASFNVWPPAGSFVADRVVQDGAVYRNLAAQVAELNPNMTTEQVMASMISYASSGGVNANGAWDNYFTIDGDLNITATEPPIYLSPDKLDADSRLPFTLFLSNEALRRDDADPNNDINIALANGNYAGISPTQVVSGYQNLIRNSEALVNTDGITFYEGGIPQLNSDSVGYIAFKTIPEPAVAGLIAVGAGLTLLLRKRD